MVSAEIGGHWVARVEALVPPVYSADAATSSTTHPHSPPTTPIRDPRPQTHLTHTLAHVCVCTCKKGRDTLEVFLCQQQSSLWVRRMAPRSDCGELGKSFAGANFSPALSYWRVRVPPFTAMQIANQAQGQPSKLSLKQIMLIDYFWFCNQVKDPIKHHNGCTAVIYISTSSD